MKTIILAENAFEPETWTRHEAEDVCAFLGTRFSRFPENGRIYHKHVAIENDVTPGDENDILRLQELDGLFVVVLYPGDFGISEIILAVIAIVSIASTVFFLTQIPGAVSKQLNGTSNISSANNDLSDRTNTQRVNGRIPDIVGQLRSTPDLIAVPYTVFESNKEVEYAYMCIGRGTYEVSDVRDGDTLISEIDGAAVKIFGPNTSPNSGSPQATIGSDFTEPVLNVRRSNSVNGQTLAAASATGVSHTGSYTATSTGFTAIYSDPDTGDLVPFPFYLYFATGNIVTLTSFTDGGFALNGDYTVQGSSGGSIDFVNPVGVTTDWNTVSGHAFSAATIALSGSAQWVGPFTLDVPTTDQVWCNFMAPNGLYRDPGDNAQVALTIALEVGVTPVDSSGSPTGGEETFTISLQGSTTSKDRVVATLKIDPTFTGTRVSVRAKRITASQTGTGAISEEVKWRDVYSISPVSNSDFGDITTVQSKTLNTDGALAVKERKLNCLVTRQIKTRISGSTFSSNLSSTLRADEIISHICKDPYIGNRADSEIDFDSIYDTIAAAQTYFGTEDAIQFCYTFDQTNVTFEETIAMIADAAFCTAFRRGKQLKLTLEKSTSDSVLLFNHRNKLPGTEKRNVRFGNINDVDGVEYKYISPDDDAEISVYIPSNQSAINPQVIESVGIRNEYQAQLHAYRAWNKIRYQNVSVEMDTTQEADLLVRTDRILIADNTRADTQDGEVLEQSVLQLTLSQPFVYDTLDHSIFLQLSDGTVQSIVIDSVPGGSGTRDIILAEAPSVTLVLTDDKAARTTYMIAGASDLEASAFLVDSRTPSDDFNSTIAAINYDARYYRNDNGTFDG